MGVTRVYVKPGHMASGALLLAAAKRIQDFKP